MSYPARAEGLGKYDIYIYIYIYQMQQKNGYTKGQELQSIEDINREQVLSIPVFLLACIEDWTCNLQMIVSLEASGTDTYNRYAMLWLTESEQATSVNSIKDVVRSSVKVPEFDKHLKRPEDISAETLLK